MPVNKNAFERYLIIDEKLRNPHRRYNLEELAEACSFALDTTIEPRTISADLKFMRERFEAPIPKRPDDNRFSYTNSRFSIMTSPLNTEELSALKKVLHILKDFPYLPQFQDIKNILLNLEFETKKIELPTPIISFDRSELWGINFLKDFYDAILHKNALLVGYRPYNGDPNDDKRFTQTSVGEQGKSFKFSFHPYFLKEFNHRWFVLGLNEARDTVDCYALDRVTSVGIQKLCPYKSNEKVDFNTYFDHILGVTHIENQAIETVQLRFRKPRAFYVRTKKWKPQQIEIAETEDSITFEWQLKYNRELEARVLEFGQDVEVLTPQWFREKIADIWQKALNNHSIT